MGKIFGNFKPYWKSIIIVFILLIGQAYCDLSLPQYTQDIIDTGIQNSGVEHILPEKMTEEDYTRAMLTMTETEISTWEDTYSHEGDIYERKEFKEDELEELDEQFSTALVLNYQLFSVDADTFRTQMAEQSGMDVTLFADMTMDDLVGMMGSEQITVMRDQLDKTFDTMGDSMVQSMGVAYAVKCDENAGIDMDKLQTNYLLAAGAKMIGISLVMIIITVAVSFFASRVGAGIGMTLRGKVFKNVVGFSNTEIDKFSTASLITRSTNDVQQVQMVSTMFLRMLAYAPILGIGGILKVVNTGAGMGWVIVLAVLLILGFVGVLMGIAMPKFKLMQKLVDRVNLVSREILTGLSVIRAFGREEKEEERFDDANTKLTKTMLFTNRVMTFMMPVMMLIMNGLTVLIVWVAAHKIDGGTMQVGAMTAFITYAMMIVMSFLMLTMMSVMLPRAAVAADRIEEVIKTKSTITDKEDVKPLKNIQGVVEFKNVDFKYPGAERNVLEGINFKAEPGKTTAIIGSTGCGKSTLINLIPRLYDVTQGQVTLDGTDIKDVSLTDLRENIGFVPQKGVLFSGTIASNLRFGKEVATDEEIAQAAAIAQATEFIEDKKDKYDSEISQGGTNVSGGQKQRLSIARAIAKNPKIYIFDDSFSALDLKTDAALRKALGETTKESTVIIVAQRISTIMHAEQIIVLEDGRMAGIGTHEELLENCQVYKQIASSQMSAKELGLEEA